MRALLYALTTLTVMFVVACQKDEGGADAALSCGPGHYATPAWGNQCLPQAQCPPGSVRNPTQLSMCMNIYTGADIGPQRCGAGYVLTSQGCLHQCPDRPGWGLYGTACVQGINASGSGYNYQMPYWQTPYGQPYGGYPYYNYYYRPY